MLFNNFKTERLIIRDMLEEDTKEVWKIWSNRENDKYMSDPVESQDEIISICQNIKEINIPNYLAVVTLKDSGDIIGTCCFGPTKKQTEWGFGYSIKQEYWGKGYATEIVKSIIAFGSSLGIKDFISDCATENIASGKVLEKSGMHFDHKSSFTQHGTNIVFESNVYKLHID